MDYTKISFKLDPDSETNREILVAYLSQVDIESFDETDDEVHGFIPGEKVYLNQLNEIIETLPFHVRIQQEIIPHQNWNEVWEKNYFKPLVIDDKLLVRAPFHIDFPKTKFELIIEPKMAFGTGNHETTSLMAEQILKADMKNKNILDMGCGTGILGMLASLKGARHVTAIDIDQQAYESTVENARINNISNLDAKLGDASLLGNESYDIIFANIHKNIILSDLPKYNEVLNYGGQLWLSGFYSEDIPDVKNKAESIGLTDNGYEQKNNWVLYRLLKKS